MKILGIETSCDETAAAVVEDGKKILSNVVASSLDFHAKTGGIIPEVAAREQVKAIIPVINEALKTSPPRSTPVHLGGVAKRLLRGEEEIDAIAVTVGPGLIGSLLVGVETAKALAFAWNKPLTPVNHLIGHVYANWLSEPQPKFPLLILLVSGGHTDLVLMKDHGKFKWLGGTRDDAAGECFDKTARLLGLSYPGGPEIAKLAEKGSPTRFPLPRPMINSKDYDFSFSGLKTAVLNLTTNYKLITKNSPADLAASIQEAIVDVLVTKTIRAAQELGVNQIALGGGVAANSRLREVFQLKIENFKSKIALHIPPPELCTDNAAVIASAAHFNQKITSWRKVFADPRLHF